MDGFLNIEQIFPGGEWKNEDEYIIRCPICGDHRTHNHCHLNPQKGVYHCFYCGEGGSLARLIKEYAEEKGQVEPRKGIIEKKKHPETDFEKFSKIYGL